MIADKTAALIRAERQAHAAPLPVTLST